MATAARTWILTTAIVVVLAAPLVAHQSVSAEYERSKPVKMKGVVTKVEWTNPVTRRPVAHPFGGQPWRNIRQGNCWTS